MAFDEHYHSGIVLVTPAMLHYGSATGVVVSRQRVKDALYSERFVDKAPLEVFASLLDDVREFASQPKRRDELMEAAQQLSKDVP